jgi:hypothetical protein
MASVFNWLSFIWYSLCLVVLLLLLMLWFGLVWLLVLGLWIALFVLVSGRSLVGWLSLFSGRTLRRVILLLVRGLLLVMGCVCVAVYLLSVGVSLTISPGLARFRALRLVRCCRWGGLLVAVGRLFVLSLLGA